jgi:hypothetical protein
MSSDTWNATYAAQQSIHSCTIRNNSSKMSSSSHLEAARLAAGVALNSEEATRFFERRAEDKAHTTEYVKRHPEIQQLLHDFVAAVLEEKPADVSAFAAQFFRRYSAK